MRCTIQKGKEWSANDSSPYHKPHECVFCGFFFIIWTNAGILLIGPLERNFSEILIEINAFSLKKIHLKGCLRNAAILSWPQCVNDLSFWSLYCRASFLEHIFMSNICTNVFLTLTHCDLVTPCGDTDLGQCWLVEVMDCSLMAPSHYFNWCWLLISKVQWYSSEGNFTTDPLAIDD